MWDLYSGLGGASEPFMQRPLEWMVFRFENNPMLSSLMSPDYVPATVHMDLRAFNYSMRIQAPDLIWASPPCLDFSNAYAAPKPTAAREGLDFKPDMKPMLRAVEIIEYFKPEHWVIENVHGAIKHFNPHLGPPRLIAGPFALWGNFPLFEPNLEGHTKGDNDAWSTDPLRANKRALIPFPLVEGLRLTIKNQSTLLDFKRTG